MLEKILKAIGALLIILIPIYVTYYVNRSRPEVRYTLSEKIPLSFFTSGTTSPEIVQQIEVKNLGNAPATDILLDIDALITQFDISKNSAADAVQTFNAQKPFQLIYDELPPQASFKFVFQSSGDGVDSREVVVRHNAGLAQEALATQESSTSDQLGRWMYNGSTLLFLLLSANSLRKIAIEAWQSGKINEPVSQVLKSRAPWYMSDVEWTKTLKTVITAKLSRGYAPSIESLEQYAFLQCDRPPSVTETEWVELVDEARSAFAKQYQARVRTAYAESQLLSILRIKKPVHLPDSEWKELQTDACMQYTRIKFRNRYRVEELLPLFSEPRPLEIPELEWAAYMSELRNAYLKTVDNNMIGTDCPWTYLQTVNLSMLNSEDRQRLEKRAKTMEQANVHLKLLDSIIIGNDLGQDKPELADETFWAHLDWRSKSLQSAAANDARSQQLMNQLKLIINRQPLTSEKPEEFDETSWKKLHILAGELAKLDKVEAMGITVKRKAREVNLAARTTSQLRRKVEKQLSIIHAVLHDPTKVERIEDYDDTFAPGNYASLRRVAEILSKPETL